MDGWAGVPLQTPEAMLGLLRGTRTRTGLRVHAEWWDRTYAKGIKVSDQAMVELNITHHKTCPRWNYTLTPRLRHAQELDLDHPELYRKPMSLAFAQRGYVKAQVNQKEGAIADMHEALRLDPTNAGVFDKRGSLHFNLKHFKEAVADFTEAIRLDPNQPVYDLHRGFAHEGLGKKGEAAEDYKKGKKQPAPK
jgi:tetratricopeptide (TPR) repeat protein